MSWWLVVGLSVGALRLSAFSPVAPDWTDAGGCNEHLWRQAFLVFGRRRDRGGDCGCDVAAQQNRGASFPGGDKRAGDDARSSRNDKSAVAYAGSPGKAVAGEKLA
jgi:hypothetical protein